MKTINIMNFVRQNDYRMPGDGVDILYQTTAAQLDLVNEFQLDNTFLLQYDAVCDPRYVSLFKENATDRTELGLWYEIVEPLTTACGLPYRSEVGAKWDWHIIPGFSMAYTPAERELLVDEAMRKFRDVFGYYPKTFASWILDTHTVNYLTDHYDISAIAICRDQTNTDAYTLIGGYFNQGYYPSRNNLFTPAQSDALRVNVPILRLLGSDPIHNYDGTKYLPADIAAHGGCYTLEPVWYSGYTPSVVEWFFRTYYENEDLGFSYAQIGQENSFGEHDLITPLRMQLEKAIQIPNIRIEKMCDTGDAFKAKYPNHTPATSVVALDNWIGSEDIQSVFYDCENYTANLFRYEEQAFIRAFYLFDENVPEKYVTETCTTFDAIYENLPIVDTLFWSEGAKKDIGLMIDTDASAYTASKTAEGELTVSWPGHIVTFREDSIAVTSDKLLFHVGAAAASISVSGSTIAYCYKGFHYSLQIDGASATTLENGDIEIIPTDGCCVLRPLRE